MPNAIITLNTSATLIADFNNLLLPQDKAILLVLGGDAARQNFAEAAQEFAIDPRFVILVSEPAAIMPVLAGLKNNVVPVPDQAKWFAIAIDTELTIVAISVDNDQTNIIPFFILAES